MVNLSNLSYPALYGYFNGPFKEPIILKEVPAPRRRRSLLTEEDGDDQ
jgi:hypothetical protein